jgi:hypothetical protein
VIKAYPRARVRRHPRINGWIIDLYRWEGAKPERVAATYATPAFANQAARVKLGPPAPRGSRVPPRPPAPDPAPDPLPVVVTAPRTRSANGQQATGTCIPCGRPMRPAGTRSAAWPNTTLRQREGLCQTCHQKAKREGTAS